MVRKKYFRFWNFCSVVLLVVILKSCIRSTPEPLPILAEKVDFEIECDDTLFFEYCYQKPFLVNFLTQNPNEKARINFNFDFTSADFVTVPDNSFSASTNSIGTNILFISDVNEALSWTPTFFNIILKASQSNTDTPNVRTKNIVVIFTPPCAHKFLGAKSVKIDKDSSYARNDTNINCTLNGDNSLKITGLGIYTNIPNELKLNFDCNNNTVIVDDPNLSGSGYFNDSVLYFDVRGTMPYWEVEIRK